VVEAKVEVPVYKPEAVQLTEEDIADGWSVVERR